MESLEIREKNLRLLGLSRKERRVLEELQKGESTPLLLSRATQISRPAVYGMLARLHARGLAKTFIRKGRKYWRQVDDWKLEETIYATKKALLHFKDGREEIAGRSDATVVIHRGAEAIRSLIRSLFHRHKGERLYGIQGDVAAIGWNKIFGVEGTNEMNRLIKKNSIIVEAILPYGWFQRQIKTLGVGWARDFEGRMTATHEIDEMFFQHGGQVFVLKNSLYLIAMNEEIIIEVHNSEIQKLLLSMFRFIQDYSRKFDVNALLRTLIVEEERKTEVLHSCE